MEGVKRTIRRRRKQGKTDYKARIGFLKSGKARIVVRKTNRYVLGQIVVSDVAQDKVLVGANSRELLSLGWPKEATGSLKSLPACYLTGFLLGKKSNEIKEGVFDIGLNRNIKKSRLYAFLKGVLDAGIQIPHDEKVLPDYESFKKNEKVGKDLDKIKENIK